MGYLGHGLARKALSRCRRYCFRVKYSIFPLMILGKRQKSLPGHTLFPTNEKAALCIISSPMRIWRTATAVTWLHLSARVQAQKQLGEFVHTIVFIGLF